MYLHHNGTTLLCYQTHEMVAKGVFSSFFECPMSP